jgi:DNA-binding transcriptional MerR regulator
MNELIERLRESEFQTRQVCNLVGLEDRQVRHWTDMRLVIPDILPSQGRHGVRRIYSYQNLIEFAITKRLVERGFSLLKVEHILKKVKNAGYFEKRKTLRILIYDDGTVELLTGQDINEKVREIAIRIGKQYKPTIADYLRLISEVKPKSGDPDDILAGKMNWDDLIEKDPKFQLVCKDVQIEYDSWLRGKMFANQGLYILPVHQIEEEIARRA